MNSFNPTKSAGLVFALVLGFILAMGSFFTVNQTERALILQFGEMVRTVDKPGLNFKVPFIQDVTYFDSRLLDYNLPVIEVNAGDQKRMVVDLYTRYRITDVLLFYKTVGSNQEGVKNRLGKIVPDIMQEVIGRVPLSDMLSERRSQIMAEIHEKVRESAKTFGIDVRDVRIIRTDLPKENSEAIFGRMESERRQEASQFRAEGAEKSQGIKAAADREVSVLLANARRQAEEFRGQGDAEAARIYSDVFDQDREFFAFYRSLEAYKTAFNPKNTSLVLNPTGPFFKYFSSPGHVND